MDKLRGASTILLTGFVSEIEAVSEVLSCLRRISSIEWGVNLLRNTVVNTNVTKHLSHCFFMLPGLVDTGAPDQRGQRYGDVEVLARAGGHRLHGVRIVTRDGV